MDWIVGVLLLVAGIIIGFFAGRYSVTQQANASKGQAKEQTLKDIMAQQAATHISQSRQVVADIEAHCEAMRHQLDAYEHVLTSDDGSAEQQRLSYFGQDADLYIRNKQPSPKKQRAPSEFQPRDFSEQGSGLFSGSKKQQVTDE